MIQPISYHMRLKGPLGLWCNCLASAFFKNLFGEDQTPNTKQAQNILLFSFVRISAFSLCIVFVSLSLWVFSVTNYRPFLQPLMETILSSSATFLMPSLLLFPFPFLLWSLLFHPTNTLSHFSYTLVRCPWLFSLVLFSFSFCFCALLPSAALRIS